MLYKPINPNKEFIGRKRKPSPMKKQKNDNIDGTIRITYKLELGLFYGKIESIRLFGDEFVKINKDDCKMIIGGEEYEIETKIRELKYYGIKEGEKELEVILKGDGITDMSHMFYC